MRKTIIVIILIISIKVYGIQFEILNIGAKNISIGGSGVSIFKDPTLTILNPANLSLDKSTLSLYYEANSSVNIGNLLDLYNRRFVFDPVNIGVSIKIDEHTRISFLTTSYIYDLDTPETVYRPMLFGISKKTLPYLLLGVSLGPVIGLNSTSIIISFIMIGGLTLKINDTFSTALVIKSPFTTTYFNPYYDTITQTFPTVISHGISYFFDNNIIISAGIDFVLHNNLSAISYGKEIFLPRENIFDYILPKLGIIYYDNISGYRIMAGFSKSQIETVSRSIPQYHLTAGATFFIRIPNFKDFEINFSIDDKVLLNLLQIAPENVRSISMYASGEVKF